MRAAIQRVSEASVTIGGERKAEIDTGLLILIGIEHEDDQSDLEWLCGKIVRMRIFPDEAGSMNRSVADVGGEIIVVSQFTLHAATKKGNRPGFTRAAHPDHAKPLYEKFKDQLSSELGKPVQSGQFGADMQVALVNDGPVTIIIDSKNRE